MRQQVVITEGVAEEEKVCMQILLFPAFFYDVDDDQ